MIVHIADFRTNEMLFESSVIDGVAKPIHTVTLDAEDHADLVMAAAVGKIVRIKCPSREVTLTGLLRSVARTSSGLTVSVEGVIE